MRLSLIPDPRRRWSELLSRCTTSADHGYEGLWLSDHLLRPDDEPHGFFLEAWSTLAALAVAMPSITLGVAVSANTLRHPALLAATARTVQDVSGGRVIMGIGAGGDEDEHAALGIDFPAMPVRMDRLDEACSVLRQLLTPGPAIFDGAHFRIRLQDTGIRAGEHIPLLVGTAGQRRGMEIVARHADFWSLWATVDEMRRLSRQLDRNCEALDRNPCDVRRVVQVMLLPDGLDADQRRDDHRQWPAVIGGSRGEVHDVVGRYRESGVDELAVCDYALSDRERDASLHEFALRVRVVVPTERGG